jgi:hypothetical protein
MSRPGKPPSARTERLLRRDQNGRPFLLSTNGEYRLRDAGLADVLEPLSLPGLVDQDSPHPFGRSGKEEPAAIPLVLDSFGVTSY